MKTFLLLCVLAVSAVNALPAQTALCRDGTYSYSQHHSGTCSWHGGVAKWLDAPTAVGGPGLAGALMPLVLGAQEGARERQELERRAHLDSLQERLLEAQIQAIEAQTEASSDDDAPLTMTAVWTGRERPRDGVKDCFYTDGAYNYVYTVGEYALCPVSIQVPYSP